MAAVQQGGLIVVRCAHVLWVCGVQFGRFKTLNFCDAREDEYRLNYVRVGPTHLCCLYTP